MPISKEQQDMAAQAFELSGKLLDQASALKQKADALGSREAVAELCNKIIRTKAREQWANAERRYYYALSRLIKTSWTGYDVHGKIVLDASVCPNCRAPEDWEKMWLNIEDRLHRYHSKLIRQFAACQPEAATSPNIVIGKE